MGIKTENKIRKISLSAVNYEARCPNRMTIALSFKYFTEEPEYNYSQFSGKSKFLSSLFKKLKSLSILTWDDMYKAPKNSGTEHLPKDQIDSKIYQDYKVRKDEDYKITVIRFGQEGRIFLKRGTECGRIANVLGFDINMKAYKHE